MCGRFTRYLTWTEIQRLYRLTTDWEKQRNDAPRYNIAPTEDVPFVTAGENGNHRLREGRWWLVPWWAKEIPKQPMINARMETANTTPAFRDAWKDAGCLIPADGFYEWTKNEADGGRDPWHIYLPGPQPFSFAGLWAHNKKLGITSCTIVTMPAGEPMQTIHDRQPAILDPSAYDAWLDPATPAGELKPLLSRNLDRELRFHRVGRGVNSYKLDDATCIEPVEPEAAQA
jgi:putative SOS response-associated peptidase YedK